jgi:hypothetical protein
MDNLITYVGLDVHKNTIAVALAETGKRDDVRAHGTIANTAAALNTLAAKLARTGAELRFCYEAGPCGYGIERQLTAAGHRYVMVAPSLIPRKPGERIKTDRRDMIVNRPIDSTTEIGRQPRARSVPIGTPARTKLHSSYQRFAAVRNGGPSSAPIHIHLAVQRMEHDRRRCSPQAGQRRYRCDHALVWALTVRCWTAPISALALARLARADQPTGFCVRHSVGQSRALNSRGG